MTKEINKSLTVGTLRLSVMISSDEANEIIKNSKGVIAKKLKRYMWKVLYEGAKKMLQEINKPLEK